MSVLLTSRCHCAPFGWGCLLYLQGLGGPGPSEDPTGKGEAGVSAGSARGPGPGESGPWPAGQAEAWDGG